MLKNIDVFGKMYTLDFLISKLGEHGLIIISDLVQFYVLFLSILYLLFSSVFSLILYTEEI